MCEQDGKSPLTSSEEALRSRLDSLREQHAVLGAKLDTMMQSFAPDALEVRRLKKRKLSVRDEIAKLERALYPDLIA